MNPLNRKFSRRRKFMLVYPLPRATPHTRNLTKIFFDGRCLTFSEWRMGAGCIWLTRHIKRLLSLLWQFGRDGKFFQFPPFPIRRKSLEPNHQKGKIGSLSVGPFRHFWDKSVKACISLHVRRRAKSTLGSSSQRPRRPLYIK